jgi:2-keto-4-pentenoate hydratase/2-oxohepta-3-ene-1,7-dioic acid hydratase in catechol pathway
MSHVAGYTVANDITSRDWLKKNSGQSLLGKSFDTFCPLGPVIVTTAALSGKLHVVVWVTTGHFSYRRIPPRLISEGV